MGTYGSRSLAVGGTAITVCDKIVEKGKAVAANMLEAKADEIEFKDGEFIVPNTNKKTIGEIAFACYLQVLMVKLNHHFQKVWTGIKRNSIL